MPQQFPLILRIAHLHIAGFQATKV